MASRHFITNGKCPFVSIGHPIKRYASIFWNSQQAVLVQVQLQGKTLNSRRNIKEHMLFASGDQVRILPGVDRGWDCFRVNAPTHTHAHSGILWNFMRLFMLKKTPQTLARTIQTTSLTATGEYKVECWWYFEQKWQDAPGSAMTATWWRRLWAWCLSGRRTTSAKSQLSRLFCQVRNWKICYIACM